MLLQHPARLSVASSRGSAWSTARVPNVAARFSPRSFDKPIRQRVAVECASPVVPCTVSAPRAHRKQQSYVCRSTTYTDPLPADLQLELNPDAAAKQVTYDEATKTVRIPLAAVNEGQRRTKMVMFTCNKCGGRSARLVNPVAWEKGAVFAQCQHCEVWHTLAAHPSIIEEIRYNDPEWQQQQQQQVSSTAVAGGSSLQEDSQDSAGTVLGLAAGGDSSQEEVSSTAAAPAAPGAQQ